MADEFMARQFAHRGLHDRTAGRIENSPSAFEAAISAGYAIELDVQLAGDGSAVVFHDRRLDRLTAEVGPVASRSSDELGHIVLAGGNDTIPTFAAILAQIAGRAPILIELKDQTGELGPSDGRLERTVARDLRDYGGPVALMSFSASMVERLAEVAPEVPRGLTTDAFAPGQWHNVPPARLAALRRIDAAAVGAAFISHDHRDLSSARVGELRAEKMPILTWTIRSPEEEKAALRRADAITFEGYRPEPVGAPQATA